MDLTFPDWEFNISCFQENHPIFLVSCSYNYILASGRAARAFCSSFGNSAWGVVDGFCKEREVSEIFHKYFADSWTCTKQPEIQRIISRKVFRF